MSEQEVMAALTAIKAEANGVAPVGATGLIQGVGRGITLPLDINQAIRVLIASFDADDLTTLSNDLAVVVQVLNRCGKARPTFPAPVPRPHPGHRTRIQTRIPPQDLEVEEDHGVPGEQARATALEVLAAQIRRALEEFRDRKNPAEVTARLRVQIGRALLEAKAILPRRGWKRWYTEHCRIGRTTMVTFVHAAQAAARGDRPGSEPAPEPVEA